MANPEALQKQIETLRDYSGVAPTV